MPVTLRGSGQVPVQVIQTVKTDTFTTTSSAFVDVTGVSATITPTSASNRVLVTITGGASSAGPTNGFGYGVVVRNSTEIAIGDARGSAQRASFDLSNANAGNIQDYAKTFCITFLDSPATTSAVVYKLQAKATVNNLVIGGSASTSDGNRSNLPTIITVMEISG
jgi:hypothetical protein